MRRNTIVPGVAGILGVLGLALVAYAQTSLVSSLFDSRMRRDIDSFASALGQSGVPAAQVAAQRRLLLSVNHDTLGYVTSAMDTVIGVVGFTGIIALSITLAAAMRPTPPAGQPGPSDGVDES